MTALAEPPRAPAQRGRLVVAKQVVEKLAAQAAVEVTTGEHRMVFAPRTDSDPGPVVAVQLDGSDTWLQVEVDLVYPAPLRATTDDLRAHLVRRVEELSGLTVRRLDIRVAQLVTVGEHSRRLT